MVERRQHIMLDKVVENANRVASAERELNEFLSHEVGNVASWGFVSWDVARCVLLTWHLA